MYETGPVPVEKAESTTNETELIYKFATHLINILSSVSNLKETFINQHLKCDKESRKRITFTVPRYKNDLGIYAVNKYLTKHSKITRTCDFCNESKEFYPATYKNVEIGRGVTDTLLTEGFYFIIHEKIPIVVYLEFCCSNPKATFTFQKKNRKVVSELVDKIEDYMKHNNFYKNERLKLGSGIYLSFLEYPKLTWNDLIINSKLKDEIIINLVFPLNNKELCKKFGLAWRRGLLLGGEPGTGKTKLSKILCNLLTDCTIIWVTAESINESSDVKILFEAARDLAPTLIIFEDLDFFGKDREIIYSPILGELLNQLDGNAPNEGIFVIASSNRPGLLDKALANRPGRFDVKLEFELPDIEDRIRMLQLFSTSKPLASDVNFKELANMTSDFTGAQIQETFVYATLNCLNNNEEILTQKHLIDAAARIRSNNKLDNRMVR
jgi:SpoVK/Ycf46/Vps4 family AAA+-type ATPase